MTRGLKYQILGSRGIVLYVVRTKAVICCAVTAQLICAFVYAYAKTRFSHEEALCLKLSPSQNKVFTYTDGTLMPYHQILMLSHNVFLFKCL